MTLVAYDIRELDKCQGYSCLFCLIVASRFINRITGIEGVNQTLNIYGTEGSRNNGLQYWRRECKLTETVFFTFEIPIDFYLEKAQKLI